MKRSYWCPLEGGAPKFSVVLRTVLGDIDADKHPLLDQVLFPSPKKECPTQGDLI